MPKRQPSRPILKDARLRWRIHKANRLSREDIPQDRKSPPHSNETAQKKTQASRTSLRAGLAVVGGRTAGALSRRLHVGGGTSIVGVVAQRLYPDIVEHLAAQLEYGSIVVTGTNGKTTTSGFIAAVLGEAGMRVWRNREGSNLMRGIASSLVIRALPNGHLRREGHAISIFEVDEAVVPGAIANIHPRIAVFNNLFRDQLDRYGEVDSIATRWKEMIAMLDPATTLVINADDPTTAHLGELFAGETVYFGIDDPSLDLQAQHVSPERYQVMDTRTCPDCGNEYQYDMQFYSHMGHYTCPHCGHHRPEATVRALKVETDEFDRLRVQVATPTRTGEIIVPLPGLYNVYNALAAVAVAEVKGIEWNAIEKGIEQFKPIFGRGERLDIEGRILRLLLAKNPTGFNEVLRTLFNDGTPRHVFFILNDNTADGKDVSWIWDVDFERLVGQTQSITIGGIRALDLGLRLKYAGVAEEEMTIVPWTPLRAMKREEASHNRNKRVKKNGSTVVEELEITPLPRRRYGIAEALNTAIQQTPEGETLFVVPTYTGLLEIHRELEQRGLTPHYWEEKDS